MDSPSIPFKGPVSRYCNGATRLVIVTWTPPVFLELVFRLILQHGNKVKMYSRNTTGSFIPPTSKRSSLFMSGHCKADDRRDERSTDDREWW